MTERAEQPRDAPAIEALPELAPDVTVERWIRAHLDGDNERDIFSRAYAFPLLDQARELDIYPFFQPLDSNDGAEGQIYGQRVLMFGSNNYLGLTRHPYVVAAAKEAVLKHGTSMKRARIVNGCDHLQEEVE